MDMSYWRRLGRDHRALDLAQEDSEYHEWILWLSWVNTYGFFPPDIAKTRQREAREDREAQMCATWEDREQYMREQRADEILLEMQHMDETLSGCDWCEGCGDGILWYLSLQRELDALGLEEKCV